MRRIALLVLLAATLGAKDKQPTPEEQIAAFRAQIASMEAQLQRAGITIQALQNDGQGCQNQLKLMAAIGQANIAADKADAARESALKPSRDRCEKEKMTLDEKRMVCIEKPVPLPPPPAPPPVYPPQQSQSK